jgi:hypothetical protein
MKLFALSILCVPGFALAEPTVLVDAIPTGGAFLGTSPIGLPFRDAEKADKVAVGQGLSAAVANLFPSADKNGISYICLLTSPGENPVEVFVAPAKANLRLSRKNTSVMAVFYRGGSIPLAPFVYSTGKPEAKRPTISVKFQKISVPPGVTTAGWVYFDLARIQAEVLKAGANTAFLQVDGEGTTSPVAIPGLKAPLLVFEGKTTFTAAWYMSAEMEAAHERELKNGAGAGTGQPRAGP